MIARLVYNAVVGREYRAFGKLPEGLEDLGNVDPESTKSKVLGLKAEIAEISRQIKEQKALFNGFPGSLVNDKVIRGLEEFRVKAIARLKAVKRQSVFFAVA